jgi:hypothetical protein
VAQVRVRDVFAWRDGTMLLTDQLTPLIDIAGLGHTPGRGDLRDDGDGGYWIAGIDARSRATSIASSSARNGRPARSSTPAARSSCPRPIRASAPASRCSSHERRDPDHARRARRARPPPGRALGVVVAITLLAVALGLFQLYTAGFRPLNLFYQRGFHLLVILLITFLAFPIGRKKRNRSAG